MKLFQLILKILIFLNAFLDKLNLSHPTSIYWV